MNEADRIRLRHILDAAHEAMQFASGHKRETFMADRQLGLAIVKDIEIIGEAAARLSEEFQHAHPEIPWGAIVGMRNQLVHMYFDIDFDQVWDTITDDLPPLIRQIESILQAADAADSSDDAEEN